MTKATVRWRPFGNATVIMCVCTRPSRPLGTRRDRVLLYCLTGEYRELAEPSRQHENGVSLTHFRGPSTPSGAFLQISDILYLQCHHRPAFYECVCVFIANTHAQRQGAKGHNNIVSTRQRQSCSNAVWGAVGWMIRAHTLIQLVGRGHSRAGQAQRSGEFTGQHSWQPILGRALGLECQGWLPTCKSFQMPQKCVFGCVHMLTHTNSHTQYWGWMHMIRSTVER